MIKFGREYSPRKFELEILEKKTAEAIEFWPEDKWFTPPLDFAL